MPILPLPQANVPLVDPQTGILTEAWRRFLLSIPRQFQAPVGTYAARPSPAVEGMLIVVTDASTATWGATIAGGGVNHVLGWFNGTNWTVVGA